jgi:hypothetical protein
MLKRLVLALLEGALPGAAAAFALTELGAANVAPAMYAAAAAAGVSTALIAGRPIWAKGAKVEGLLKAVAGLFIAVTMLFGVRKWLPGMNIDLGAFGAGAGPVGSLPWVVLPAICVAFALVLEIDDAIGADPDPVPRRVQAESAKTELLRVEGEEKDEQDGEDGEGASSDDARAHRRG